MVGDLLAYLEDRGGPVAAAVPTCDIGLADRDEHKGLARIRRLRRQVRGLPAADLAIKPTAEQAEQLLQHPMWGGQMLRAIGSEPASIEMAEGHHRQAGGGGYPESQKHLPLSARIGAVADAWHAMVSDRPYRKGKTFDYAVGQLQKFSGSQFDPAVVKAFLSAVKGGKLK